MKKTNMLTLVAALCITTFLTVGVVIATDSPEEVTIENEGYKKDKKGIVKFNHNKHVKEFEIGCSDCHHKFEDGKNIWKEGDPVEKCAECHNPVKEEGETVMNLKKAFHKKCTGCHSALEKKGKITKDQLKALKKCSKCHEKKAK
jgi:hypothetical protein